MTANRPRTGVRIGRAGVQGFTYLWILFAVAALSIGLVAVSELWTSIANRQRVAQLEWVGRQFERAIASFYESAPAGERAYPATLELLLEDRRFPVPRRHLRKVYPDPWTGRADWDLVSCGSVGVCGVRSRAHGDGGRAYVYIPPPAAWPAR